MPSFVRASRVLGIRNEGLTNPVKRYVGHVVVKAKLVHS